MKKESGRHGACGEECKCEEKENSSCCGAEKEESCTSADGEQKPCTEGDSEGVEQKTCASTEERLKEAEAETEKWKESYLRKAADFDNYRKRMIKEKQEAIDFANGNLLTDLVQVLDDFDRAVEAGEKHGGEAAKAFMEGFIMIKKQLSSMLESKYGLTYYPAKGENFDPNLHEAVSILQDEKTETPVVAEELRKGYKLKDRVLRGAQVAVLMPAKKENKTEEKTETTE